MKIAIFDDHPVIVNAIESYLKRKPKVTIVGTATTRDQALQLLQNNDIDIFISDVITDEELGLELFERIKSLNLNLKVIVYSSVKVEFVHNFLYEYGVVAIVNKEKTLDTLWETIQIVYMNQFYRRPQAGDNQQPPILYEREREIARYMARGLSAKEIAQLTNTSVNTINNQKNHLLSKFGCVNATELIARLTSMGYIKI